MIGRRLCDRPYPRKRKNATVASTATATAMAIPSANRFSVVEPSGSRCLPLSFELPIIAAPSQGVASIRAGHTPLESRSRIMPQAARRENPVPPWRTRDVATRSSCATLSVGEQSPCLESWRSQGKDGRVSAVVGSANVCGGGAGLLSWVCLGVLWREGREVPLST